MAVSMSPPRVKGRVTGTTRYEKEVASARGISSEEDRDPIALGPWILGDTIGKGTSGGFLLRLFVS